MPDPVCPETGQPMVRGVRPMTITYKGRSATFDMPGWYCDESGEGIHTGADMAVSDRELDRLKATVEAADLSVSVKTRKKNMASLGRRS